MSKVLDYKIYKKKVIIQNEIKPTGDVQIKLEQC